MLVILKLIFMITLIKNIGMVCSTVGSPNDRFDSSLLLKKSSRKRVAGVQDERTASVWRLALRIAC
jgi:hypothetical protein